MSEDYEINEKDIDSVLCFLKIYDPANATPENAISILEDMDAYFHKLSHENPGLLEKFQKDVRNN